MKLDFIGLGLIALCIVYQVKPNLFRRWLWMRTSIAIRALSPQAYERYRRRLGLVGVGRIVYNLCLQR